MTPDALEYLRCPVSGERLHQDGADLVNESGQQRWPVVLDIPDFRLFDPPYLTRAAEARLAECLWEAAQRLDYAALIRYYETELCGQRPAAQIEKDITHRLALRRRSPQRLHHLFAEAGDVALPAAATVLDLGCGSGEAIAALYERGAARVVGVDISLIELVFARKLLAEQGQTALLVAGCAEALPFASAAIGLIYSPDVIEHVSDQHRYLQEAYRVLTVGGQILLNSPNRYAVVCPEPHVGLWGLGFLPRAWMDPCCRVLGKGPYIGKRLVSLPELRRLTRENFDRVTIRSRAANPQATSLPGRLFHALSPPAEQVFAYVCDQHVVLAGKHH